LIWWACAEIICSNFSFGGDFLFFVLLVNSKLSPPPSKILFFALLAFIVGVGVGSFWAIPSFIIGELFVLGFFYFLFFLLWGIYDIGHHKTPRYFLAGIALGLCLLALGFGCWRAEGVSTAKITDTHKDDISSFFALGAVKEKFREVIKNNLPSPQSAILGGILLGDKLNISREWKQKLSYTATSHIVAVSGMHIIILTQIIVGLGIIMGLYRQQALWLSLNIIWLFTALIGFPASAVRAAVMGSFLLLCQILGRQSAGLRALILAVALMLAIQPHLLRYNLGFQLSVLATLGLIHFGGLVEKALERIKIFYVLGLPAVMSPFLSAQVFVLPLLIYNFGYISLVGFVVNIFIAPLILPIMVLGFIFLLFGALSSALAIVLAWPVGVLLSLMVDIVDIFSKMPWAVWRF